MKPSSHDKEHPMTTNDRNAGDQSSTGVRKDGRMSRRNILLAGTALAAASAARQRHQFAPRRRSNSSLRRPGVHQTYL